MTCTEEINLRLLKLEIILNVKHVELPADVTGLIPQTLMITYLLIAILSASFSSYVRLVSLFIFSNFFNVFL